MSEWVGGWAQRKRGGSDPRAAVIGWRRGGEERKSMSALSFLELANGNRGIESDVEKEGGSLLEIKRDVHSRDRGRFGSW